jgi:UDP-N-acetyl-D-mannosaminuronic acid dehydrogenase
VKILSPGPGVGGHCISVDPWFLVEAAPELATLIASARRVNDAQPAFVVDVIRRALGPLKGKKVAALGLAYKRDVDDVRESPAAEVVRLLEKEGATVKAWEPFRPDAALPGVAVAASLESAISDAEAIVLLVPHTEFLRLNALEVASLTRARTVVDAVNGWSQEDWGRAGFRVIRLTGMNQ